VRKILTILIASIVFAALIPVTSATSAICWNYTDKERSFAKKINGSRGNHHVGRLQLDPQLSRVASKQTNSMIDKNELYHTPNLGSRVTRWRMLAENVGYGNTVRSLHKMFMKSSGHKHNILNGQYEYVGISAKQAHGWLWVTVVFQSEQNPGTTLSMPRC
jgi:uncharacterized protein YkwD